MLNYEKLYRILFNGITDALMNLDKNTVDAAKARLILAQQEAENYYILDGESDAAPPHRGRILKLKREPSL